MTSVRKRRKHIRFAREFPSPTPEESDRIRQELHDSGHYEWPDHAMVNWVRELNGDEARLAKVRERLAALRQHLPGMTYEQVRALGDADEEELEPDSPDAPRTHGRGTG